MLETIKSYLVSLGFAVDKPSFGEATKSMDTVKEGVTKFAGSAVKQFAIAGAAVLSFVTAASVGIAKFVNDLASTDLANEKLARQMWTTKENAAAFNNTLKAMGVTLQDLYLSPELMQRFQQLRQQTMEMRPPQEYSDQMKMIRSIQFEFTRMKLEATYALQWIGYYFVKYMGGPIRNIKKTLSEINDTIIKTMPSWTKVVAQVMSWFARMGETTVRAIRDVIRVFDDIGDAIPKNVKLIGGAIAALALIVQSGPIGMMVAAFTLLILLLDDFYTYLDGGESAFGPFWKKITGFFDMLKGNGVFDDFKQNFKDALENISKFIDGAKEVLKSFYSDLKENGTLDNLKQTFENTFGIIEKLLTGAKSWVKDLFTELSKSGVLTDLKDSFEHVILAVSDLYASVTNLINKLLGLDGTKDTLSGIGDVLNDVIIVALETVSALLDGIAGSIEVISSVLKGSIFDFSKKAGDEAAKRIDEDQPAEKGMNWLERTMSGWKDLFTNGERFHDKLIRGVGNLSNFFSGGKSSEANGPALPSYLYAQPNNTSNSNNKVTLNQTNNIYGSDPIATANAAHDNLNMMYARNMTGVIR